MSLSIANRRLLEKKFGRALPDGDPKVSLTISAIGKLLDAAREEGRSERPRTIQEAREDNIGSILEKVAGKTGRRFF